MYSIPNDAISTGYKQKCTFNFEQVFYSKSANFTGTEREFVQAGHGYQYIAIDQFTRSL